MKSAAGGPASLSEAEAGVNGRLPVLELALSRLALPVALAG